jgi:hypothetical protein
MKIRHPERNEVKSRDPVDVTLKVSRRDPSTRLGMTKRFPPSALM